MKAIEVKGVSVLNSSQTTLANKILNEYYVKIQRQLKNFTSLKLHVKAYEKGNGSRKKYSLRVEVISPTRKFESNAHDWDFARTLHKVLNKVINEIEHETHASDGYPRKARFLKRIRKLWGK
ncbi:MAG: hypothetical protein PVG65_03915 [Candidatus Thorarchaeota archaeon]|jgi:hypothetical protein